MKKHRDAKTGFYFFVTKSVMIVMVGMMLSACSSKAHYQNINLETPAQKLDSKMQMSKTTVQKSWPVDLNAARMIKNLAKDYTNHGTGDVHVMVTYDGTLDEKTQQDNRNDAAFIAQSIRQSFADEGVNTVEVRVAPVPEARAGVAVVSYDALIVQLPEECRGKSLLHVKGHMDVAQDYHFGCDNKNLMARMVANKKDMLGKSEMSPASSARLGTAIETYQAGDTVGEGDLNVTTSQLNSAGQ